MKLKSVYKIPEGKLIKIFLEYDKIHNRIVNINITGDFFAYPEESIEVLEKELEDVTFRKKTIYNKIKDVIKLNNFEFIGLNAEGLTEGILRCVQ